MRGRLGFVLKLRLRFGSCPPCHVSLLVADSGGLHRHGLDKPGPLNNVCRAKFRRIDPLNGSPSRPIVARQLGQLVSAVGGTSTDTTLNAE